MNNIKLMANKNIAIVTHRPIMPAIPGGDLKRFLLNHGVRKLIYISHPLLLLKEDYKLSSQFECYEKGRLKKNFSSYHFSLPMPLAFIKDFIFTLYWVLKTGQNFDIFFGINNMNALSGLVLKKMGRVKKVIYYTIDLYPQRFSNKLMNWLYHKVDKLCVKYCNETWNVSPYLKKYRKNSSRQFTVPIGIWFDEMKRVNPRKANNRKIVYVGHLKNFYGVDLIIRSLPEIVKKIPQVKLEIIGGGEQLAELEDLIEKLSMKPFVKFHGWKDKKVAEGLMADAALGLAPFNTEILDEKVKNADPAKIKDYLALGLPVVMTNASLNAPLIAKSKCGLIVLYNEKSLAQAVVKLLSNDKLRLKYRENALNFVKQFDWNKLFSENLSRLL